MDDGTEVKAHHWKFEKYNAQVSTHQEENDYLRNFWLRGKEIEVLEYAQDLGHCYSNCHSLTFTGGKAGWMAKPEVVEKILKGNGFKEVLRGNFATDSPQWPTHHAPSQHRQAEASCI